MLAYFAVKGVCTDAKSWMQSSFVSKMPIGLEQLI